MKENIVQRSGGINDWKYYNHAAIPTTAPHESPDMSPIINGTIWKIEGGTPYLVRWTTDFDCDYETDWWYCIKDTPFDITTLPSKKRYEINKGKKNFHVRIISPALYVEDIIRIQKAAWDNYPESYRPVWEPESLKERIKGWNQCKIFGAFSCEDEKLHAYAMLIEHESHVDFAMLKTEPSYEKRAINAAIVAAICEHYNKKVEEGYYISDGERNILHETAFQDYLIKYFGFRRAYCKLNVVYRKPFGLAVKICFPFISVFEKFKANALLGKINGVLTMEKYRNKL